MAFNISMSELVETINREYAQAMGYNFPPNTQQMINAICKWINENTTESYDITDVKTEVITGGFTVTLTFTMYRPDGSTYEKAITYTIPVISIATTTTAGYEVLDEYTKTTVDVTFTDGTVQQFDVYTRNGKIATDISLVGYSFGVDTTTNTIKITYDDGTTDIFEVESKNGEAATVDVGAVTTLAEGASATVTNSGTTKDAVFDFGIPVGATGNGIASIIKTDTDVLVDTYTITFTSGDTYEFTVTNGNGISSIVKTSTDVLVDTYTINYTDGTSMTFDISNGNGIVGVEEVGDEIVGSQTLTTLRFTYTNGETDEVVVYAENAPTIADVTFERDSEIIGDTYTFTTAHFNFTMSDESVVSSNGFTIRAKNGEKGDACTVSVGEVETLEAGEEATVTNSGTDEAAVLNFGIPKGDKGETGEKGDAATVEVGSVTTLYAGEEATVTNSGDEHNAVLNFAIPRGENGSGTSISSIEVESVETVGDDGKLATITSQPDDYSLGLDTVNAGFIGITIEVYDVTDNLIATTKITAVDIDNSSVTVDEEILDSVVNGYIKLPSGSSLNITTNKYTLSDGTEISLPVSSVNGGSGDGVTKLYEHNIKLVFDSETKQGTLYFTFLRTYGDAIDDYDTLLDLIVSSTFTAFGGGHVNDTNIMFTGVHVESAPMLECYYLFVDSEGLSSLDGTSINLSDDTIVIEDYVREI